jgi:hypothetical protein
MIPEEQKLPKILRGRLEAPGARFSNQSAGIRRKNCQIVWVWLCARIKLQLRGSYCPIELATDENTLFELDPINRMVPTTSTRMTANMTAYSAMSWPSSSDHNLRKVLVFIPSPF